MHCGRGSDVLGAFVSQLQEIKSSEETLAAAQDNRRNGNMQLVNQPSLKILPDRRRPATETHVQSVSRLPGALQGGVDAIGDEMKGRAALHLDRRARMMGENEYLCVIRRVVTPPALPFVIRPCAANRSEHITPQNPRTDSVQPAFRKIVVNTRRTVAIAVEFLESARRKEPLVEVAATNAQRIVEVLVRTGPKPIKRYRKTMNT